MGEPIEQFPEKELIRINDVVFIHRLPYDGGIYRVYFNVGVQYFQIGIDQDEEEGARFTAKMFIKALERFREGAHLPEKDA